MEALLRSEGFKIRPLMEIIICLKDNPLFYFSNCHWLLRFFFWGVVQPLVQEYHEN